MTTSRTAMRQQKLSVNPPLTVPRLTGTEPLLSSMSGSAELIESIKPQFATTLHLQAVGLPGRSLPLMTKDEQIMPHLFNVSGVRYVQPHPNNDPSQRILLLNVEASSSTPNIILEVVEKHGFELITSFPIEFGYDHVSSDQILEALLPKSIVQTEGVPSGFTIVGHIAHLNLLEIYLPFRYLVGHVILSKHASTLRTVVNKLDTIDTEFRFFKMELLAGEPDYVAKVSESDCCFEFDFRSVYWNSRLHAEHMRLIKKCRPGQVLGDVMAGVGPFAVPAAKRGVWVLANDLNPSSHESLVKNGSLNKVLLNEDRDGGKDRFDGGLIAKCMDGREFIRWSMEETWKRNFKGRPKGYDGKDEVEKEDESLREFGRRTVKARQQQIRKAHAARQASKSTDTNTKTTNITRTTADNPTAAATDHHHLAEATSRLSIDDSIISSTEAGIERWEGRKMIDHFVMNLPATALEFLDSFSGSYTHLADVVGKQNLLKELEIRTSSSDSSFNKSPMVHVHCFSKDPFQPALDILNRANKALNILNDAPYRLMCKPILPPPQTFAGLKKFSSSINNNINGGDGLGEKEEVSNYLTSHPDCSKYKSTPSQTEFMSKVNHEWLKRDKGQHTQGLEIHYVRDVAPNKQMYCLSFPIPTQVLWA
nr:related to met-10 protein [Melanopsichium pennsylvanicum 4]